MWSNCHGGTCHTPGGIDWHGYAHPSAHGRAGHRNPWDSGGAGHHGHTMENTGGNGSHNNMPPFYVLAYIMKL